MTTALNLKHTEAYMYALGRQHSGSEISPHWFAASYESAKESWESTPGTKGKWIGVAAYYERFMKDQTSRAA
jgi:hypothetical protein